jgi:hypothetical protein
MQWNPRVGPWVVAVILAAAPAADADVVTDWNAIMVATVSTQNPFAQARVAAIVHLAVFEAVNAVTRDYAPYLDSPVPVTRPASPEAAAVAAAHRVLATYFPANAASLEGARLSSLAALPDGARKANGVAVGEAAAAAMIARRAADGSAPPAFHVPSGVAPGEWQLTPGCPPAGGVLAHWGQVIPFGIPSAELFHSAPPPPLSSRRYARDLNEVKAVGGADSSLRSPHHTDVARFYAAVLAVATWNPAVSQVSLSRPRRLAFNARLFALVNMAISDALVAVMNTKYEYTFWRPETAIRAAGLDGNRRTSADPGWTPLVAAPCFPSYGSAHAAASYAARTVAEALLGDGEIDVTLSHPAVAGVVLDYCAFEEITDDIDDARVYGGIHFRFDQRAGAAQGRRIGAWMVRHELGGRR